METAVNVRVVDQFWGGRRYVVEYRSLVVYAVDKSQIGALLKEAVSFNRFNQNKYDLSCEVECIDEDTFIIKEEGH
jgi:hypothetical protein